MLCPGGRECPDRLFFYTVNRTLLMPTRVLAEADVKLFLEDANGVKLTTDPFLTYCYAEGISISSSAAFQRRGVTGRSSRKIIRKSCGYDEVTLDIDSLYVRKSQELDATNIFNTKKQLQIWLDFNDVSLTVAEKEVIILSYCRATSFKITGSNAESIKISASFIGEQIS